MQYNTSRRSYITSSQNWNNFLTEVSSPNTLLRLARTRQHFRVLLYRQQYDVLNNEGFVTGSTRRRISAARVTDAELTQNNLFSTAYVEAVTHGWVLSLTTLQSAAPLMHTSLSYWSLCGTQLILACKLLSFMVAFLNVSWFLRLNL